MVRLAAAFALFAALAATATRAGPRDLLIEAELEPAQVHVQTQAVYRLRFYQGIDVRNLEIVGPTAALADVRPIGEARVREALRDGRRYRVHERSYAVFPFASGRLDLAGAHTAGRVAAAGEGSADGRRAMRIEAPARPLAVLPIPAGAAGPVATALTLGETWETGQARVGEALRRRIRIEAAGVEAGQLPELRFEIPGVTIHAEPPRLENRFRGELNIASREQVFTLVPQRGGEVSVPELRLAWWDVQAGTPAGAALPARTLQVAGGAPAPASAIEPMPPAPPILSPPAAGIAFALVVSAALAWTRRARLRAAWRLRRACRSGQAAAVRDALLAWAACRQPGAPAPTLGALAARLRDPAACHALERIERRLYGPPPPSCDADDLAAAVRLVRRDLAASRALPA